MATTPNKSLQSPSNPNPRSQFSPVTPKTLPTRRSTRLNSILFDSPNTPHLLDASKQSLNQHQTPKRRREFGDSSVPAARSRLDFSRKGQTATRKSAVKVRKAKYSAKLSKTSNRKGELDEIQFAPQSPELSKSRKNKVDGEKTVEPLKKRNGKGESVKVLFAPTSPEQSEIKKRKRKNGVEKTAVTTRGVAKSKVEKIGKVQYYKKVVYDGGEFEVGNDVYVKRREDATSDEEDPEVEDCRLCFSSGEDIMIECDSCLGGFHLKCLKPPLKEVPEGDWICEICEGRKMGKDVDFPKPPAGKKLVRTMRQRLQSSDLWAARIERYDISFVVMLISIMNFIYMFCLM